MALSEGMQDVNDADVDGEDPVLCALDELTASLFRARSLSEQAAARARAVSERRRLGQSYRAIAEDGEHSVVELISRIIDELIAAGGTLRRAQAKALYEEGATMEEIAALFGVSRQRVGVLLGSARAREIKGAAETEEMA